MYLTHIAIAGAIFSACLAEAQIIPLPHRPKNAPTGSEFFLKTASMAPARREEEIYSQIIMGNVPKFLQNLCPVTVTNLTFGKSNWATIFVAPDYLAVGTDEDYFLIPMTPRTAQRIADQLGCTLPTPKMVDAIYAAAEVKLAPTPLPSGPQMTTLPVFAEHNRNLRLQRATYWSANPLGALVAGHKKDVVICRRLGSTLDKVAIYGWQQTNGTPIQPLYLGHTSTWVDYSHGIRLVQQKMMVNGQVKTVADVLADPHLTDLLSDEGVLTNPRYPTNARSATVSQINAPAWVADAPDLNEFTPTGHFGERSATFAYMQEIRVQVNAPAAEAFAPDRPVQLILYALPNGNSIEQTVGRTIRPGDDWHYDIQHIGAQTRFLRELVTNYTVVVAYLEAGMKSWPSWRRKYGDTGIPEIVGRIKRIFLTNQVEVVLTGHSGGGSFTFGYLNAVDQIPDDVVRIAFLDSNYAYDTTNHLAKLTHWIKASPSHQLCVLAYNDAVALLNGKPLVSEAGGTWGRSQAMLRDLGTLFPFTRERKGELETSLALDRRIELLLKDNPNRRILHTVQVERNGFIHAMLTGTPCEGRGYEYFGERAYSKWILPE